MRSWAARAWIAEAHGNRTHPRHRNRRRTTVLKTGWFPCLPSCTSLVLHDLAACLGKAPSSGVTPVSLPPTIPRRARSRARGHHLQVQAPHHGKFVYTAYIRLKGHPRQSHHLRPEGGRHPLGQAARNRRPDRRPPDVAPEGQTPEHAYGHIASQRVTGAVRSSTRNL